MINAWIQGVLNEARALGKQLWDSMFRHSYDDTGRTRGLRILGNVWLHLHPIKVPKHATNFFYTWGLGGLTFYVFLIEVVTGVLLMFYYVPDVRRAFWDMKDLQFVDHFGIIMRNLHRWGAHAMVILVMFHMLRVFLTGSYKPPREFNWIIGVLLLVFTLLLSFTGYLLPWDQLGIWAITVGTNMARATPFLGHEGPFGPQLGMRIDNDIRFALLGGTTVAQNNALLRFYVGHCIGLPAVASLLMIVHFWRVRKDGGLSGPGPHGRIIGAVPPEPPRPAPAAAKSPVAATAPSQPPGGLPQPAKA